MSIIRRCPDCGLISDDAALVACPSDGSALRWYDPSDAMIGRTLAGRFVVERLLGRGGMGAVYLARQLSVDRDVAVKVLRVDAADDANRVRRFLREAKATSHLRSPHTVTVYDFGQADDGTLFLVMEHLVGRTLQGRLAGDGAMSVREALEFADGVTDSLAEAHAAGIVHRDLKPANIFLAAQGDRVDFPKVLDFGIAQAQALDGEATITASNVIVGSVAYMSPEMIEGRQVDARADIYAVGIILWECLAGRRPFGGDTRFQLMQQHLHAMPPSLTDVLPHASDPTLLALSDLVDRCLAKPRELRPSDGRDLKRRIAGLLAMARTEGDSGGAWDESMGFERTVEARGGSRVSTSEPAAPRDGAFGGLASSAPAAPLQTGADTRPRPPRTARASRRTAAVLGLTALGAVAAVAVGPHYFSPEPDVDSPAPPTDLPAERSARTEARGLPALGLTATEVAIQRDSVQDVAQPARVSVRLESRPAGAAVVRDGTVLGSTPMTLPLRRGRERTRVTLRLDGHRDHTVDLVADRDDRFLIELEPVPPDLTAVPPGGGASAGVRHGPGRRAGPRQETGTPSRGAAGAQAPSPPEPDTPEPASGPGGANPTPAERKDEAAEVLLD